MDLESGRSKTQNILVHSITLLCISLQIIQPTAKYIASENCATSCGNISVKHPFVSEEGCGGAFPYKQLLQCNGKKLHLRTVSGLFEVQEINYEAKTMAISDPSMSTCSSLNPIADHQSFSPDSLLPPTPHNTILLLNCSRKYSGLCKNTSSVDCQALYGSCPAFDGLREQVRSSSSSLGCCATDFQRLGKRSLKELQCSHYTNLYRKEDNDAVGAYGIRLSFSIPDRGLDLRLCDECQRPDGDCGIALRCICNPDECKHQVLSGRATMQFVSQKIIMGAMLFWFVIAGSVLWNLLV